MINLTHEERLKFAEYCREQADSYRQLVGQFNNLPGGDRLAEPIKLKIAGFLVVADHLSSGEITRIG